MGQVTHASDSCFCAFRRLACKDAWGGVFLKLLDTRVFNAVAVNPDFGCVEWPGGVDLCPDAMHQAMTASESEAELHSAATLREEAKENKLGSQPAGAFFKGKWPRYQGAGITGELGCTRRLDVKTCRGRGVTASRGTRQVKGFPVSSR